ncbi:MAG: histidine triad nucleotide-binding protein [Planctomycetaceae bacterium]|nr:histidine triad nucleotide-binding protein [Planctomycetaceae bacterium]
MAEKTVFQKIIDREIPASIVYEDEHCLVFRDIDPQAPTHLLLIPKKPIPSLAALTAEDRAVAGHLLMMVPRIAQQLNLDAGFRVVCNCGEQAGQAVPHLHLHILAGRAFGWPPG